MQDLVPKEISNAAVPSADAVPLMEYIRLPGPLANVPSCKIAVRPVTPVDDIGEPAVYFAPLPPSYGTVMVLLYSMPDKGELDTCAAEQFKAEIAGMG